MEEDSKERVGIRMDVLYDIIDELNGHPELQKIFGAPVARSLFAVAEDGDFRIEEAGIMDLNEDEAQTFMHILNGIVKSKAI
jgi:hypothetical protein